MNNETMAIGTGLILLGLYNTYTVQSEIGYINEIFLLGTGALIVDHANDDENVFQTLESVGKRMVGIKGE